MAFSESDVKWFARRDGTVRGPFTETHVARYIMLGRIRFDDEISLDRNNWLTVSDCFELFPEELSGSESWGDYKRLLSARSKVDERVAQRRKKTQMVCLSGPHERRKIPDRRNAVRMSGFLEYYLLASRVDSGKSGRQILRALLLAALLASLVFIYFSSSFR